jgi:hypothetical protein
MRADIAEIQRAGRTTLAAIAQELEARQPGGPWPIAVLSSAARLAGDNDSRSRSSICPARDGSPMTAWPAGPGLPAAGRLDPAAAIRDASAISETPRHPCEPATPPAVACRGPEGMPAAATLTRPMAPSLRSRLSLFALLSLTGRTTNEGHATVALHCCLGGLR